METCDQVEFDVVEVADTMGWQLPLVKRGLRQLQWSTDRGLLMFFLCRNMLSLWAILHH